MMKIIVVKDDGSISVTENVLDYNLIDVDLIQKIAADDFETELSQDEIEEVEDSLSSWDELPDLYQLQGIIQDVIDDRE